MPLLKKSLISIKRTSNKNLKMYEAAKAPSFLKTVPFIESNYVLRRKFMIFPDKGENFHFEFLS